ncbi:protein kinase domain-containing protein [Dokdonella immobilis]|uniref:Non-specific serine/threonine protein kinase n=1 Tax=Dokdonella immobilis TaxID=578942 RepID=A0A1I4ZMF4_9GAMM|nr:winged helix-turn-helix domain-containing protein [Dokdonella immobilis]SFN51446.1 non-specific serine/threonine protein kinase [Dokdonella immobilis]
MEGTAYTYRFGSAEFDEARFELRVAGLPVDVEPRALEVLAYLLRHVGEVVGKDALLEHVWAGRVTVDKVLPNAINKLRRALGERNARHLTTQQRIGYRFDGPVARVAVGTHATERGSLRADDRVPGRDNFLLRQRLGERPGSEVWLAEHAKTLERRVYKFASDGERLRDLKREVTVSRLLQESARHPEAFVDIFDWNFESAPYFLECEYGGSNLVEWSSRNLSALEGPARLALFLQVADAVAEAHALGVLHKDLKPANILVETRDSGPFVRLTDFGNASLLDPDRLEALGITRLGMTVDEGANLLSGTPLYMAPELFAGQPPNARSDVFALGVLLYQLLSDRIGRPMVSGWEKDIDDALLREDIHLATNGDPECRFASAVELAAHLRQLEARRAHAQDAEHAAAQARAAAQALARSRARRPFVIILIATLGIGLAVALALQQAALHARNEARAELERANALSAFLNEDLISRSNPRVFAKGASASLRDVLLAARSRLDSRFTGQPLTEAGVRASLGGLFESIDLWAEAEAETRRAMDLYAGAGGANSRDALRQRSRLARLLSLLSRHEEAAAEIATLKQALAARADAESRYLVAAPSASYNLTRGEMALAVPDLEAAVSAVREFAPANTMLSDSLRTQLIFAYTLTGALDAAQREGKALIDEARARPGDNAIAIAMAEVALARSTSLQKRPAEAFAMLDEAETVIVERLGTDHSQHLRLVNEQFGVAFRTPDWPRALVYGERVYKMVRDKLGPDHGQTLVSLVNWGRALYETGHVAEARERFAEAHRKLAESQGPNAPQTQDAAFALAATEAELGHLDAAQALVDGIDADVLVAAQGNRDWTYMVEALHGLILFHRGNMQAALPLLESGVKGLDAGKNPDSEPERIHAVCRRALATLHQGRKEGSGQAARASIRSDDGTLRDPAT